MTCRAESWTEDLVVGVHSCAREKSTALGRLRYSPSITLYSRCVYGRCCGDLSSACLDLDPKEARRLRRDAPEPSFCDAETTVTRAGLKTIYRTWVLLSVGSACARIFESAGCKITIRMFLVRSNRRYSSVVHATPNSLFSEHERHHLHICTGVSVKFMFFMFLHY